MMQVNGTGMHGGILMRESMRAGCRRDGDADSRCWCAIQSRRSTGYRAGSKVANERSSHIPDCQQCEPEELLCDRPMSSADHALIFVEHLYANTKC